MSTLRAGSITALELASAHTTQRAALAVRQSRPGGALGFAWLVGGEVVE